MNATSHNEASVKRRCHWCGKHYNAARESSIWCEKNPHRGRGAGRIKPRIVTIPVLIR